MYNLLISGLVGLSVWLILAVPHLLTGPEAALPAAIATVVSLVVLARRTFKQLEAIMMRGAASLQTMPPRIDAALATMHRAYPLARWQLGVRAQIDAQIGMILFLQREFTRALPYLERSVLFGHWLAGAMHAVVQYKKRDPTAMRKTFATVSRRAKKQGIVWCLWAYLLMQLGERDEAIGVLARGVKAAPTDTRVRDALLALQNNRRIKMRAYNEQWYQFHLERPPAQMQTGPMGGRTGRISRRMR